jgi:soluble lytic murein transglycosylase-like protein
VKWRALLAALALATASVPGRAIDVELPDQLDTTTRLAIGQALVGAEGFESDQAAVNWMLRMSTRLRRSVPDVFYRAELLRLIHGEARRAGLEPELVIALIEVESSFNRFAVSERGARGLMQVMPFWKKELGHPGDDLFYPATNIRYGCTILRRYLDRTGDDLGRALMLYNGTELPSDYADRVLHALGRYVS